MNHNRPLLFLTVALALGLGSSRTSAQQPQPTLADYTRLVQAIEQQRNFFQTMHIQSEVARLKLEEEATQLRARVKELEGPAKKKED